MYRSHNIVRVIKARTMIRAGHIARIEEGTSAFKVLTCTPTRERTLGKSRRRWEDNTGMEITEIGINTRN